MERFYTKNAFLRKSQRPRFRPTTRFLTYISILAVIKDSSTKAGLPPASVCSTLRCVHCNAHTSLFSQCVRRHHHEGRASPCERVFHAHPSPPPPSHVLPRSLTSSLSLILSLFLILSPFLIVKNTSLSRFSLARARARARALSLFSLSLLALSLSL